MSFGASFAQGYQVGEAHRKRRATSKFFEKFKELSADDEEEMVAEDGTAIPLDGPAGDEVRAAIPAAAAEAGAPGGAATGETVLPLETAAPASEAPAAPVSEPIAAIPVAEKAAPAAAPEVPKTANAAKAPKKSLAQDDIKELDRLAMEAARASGDVGVYTALQQTTNSFLQGKVLSNMGLAQTAARNGDVDATEKYLRKAYRFVPDGQEIDFKRRDGKLYVQDPWSDKGEEVELGAEQIGYLGTMIRDPEKWSEMVRSERKDRAAAALAERGVAADELRAKSDSKMTDAQIKNFADKLGLDQRELGIKERAQTLDEINGKVSRLVGVAQATYYDALGEKMRADGKAGISMDVSLDDAREVASEIDDQFLKYAEPPKDLAGNPVKDWDKPKDIADLSPQQLATANGFAQAIGAANAGRVSPMMSVQAGLALARSGAVDADGNPLGEVTVDSANGVMMFGYNGQQIPIKLPRVVVDGLRQDDAQREAGAAQGLPSAIPMNQNPTGVPAKAW